VALALSVCGLGLVVCARPALRILAGPAFQGAAALVPVIVLAYYIRSLGDVLRSLFLVAGRTGCDAITNWLGSLVCLAGYLILIPRFGIWGAAFATLAGFCMITAITAVWTYRVRRYRVEGGRLGKIGIGLIVATLPSFALPASSLAAQMALAAVSLTMFPVTLWALRLATPGELRGAQAAVQAAVRLLHGVSGRAGADS
jgi:O-antigen/teichoic acid export membrane protein